MRLGLLALLVAASCGSSTTSRGVGYTWVFATSFVDGTVVRIPIKREGWRSTRSDCGLVRVFGIGEHDCVNESSTSVGVEELGTVSIDLQTGQCSFVRGPVPRGPAHQRHEERLRHGDRTFVATTMRHLVELDAAGTEVAVHQRPLAFRPEGKSPPWFSPFPWMIGETHHGRTLALLDGELVLVADNRSAIHLDGARTVYRLGDSGLAATSGMVIGLEREWKARDLVTPIQGVPRVTTFHTHWLVEAEGRYWYVEKLTGKMTELGTGMVPIGTSGTMLVLDATDYTLLVFDVASRTWRDINYRACSPLARTP